ncbi:CHAT domain-containing protein [Micromonospora sp. WMMD998]|uniref:CHAT domain-containing tetratricopeptide repeat protein n=1 Tax=Micromonospora sp. WMMD998 TaxID=3016092 RepID=UPI00249AC229|nr:CHAT domain-containing protein [Micromonospora sp. WMMD998]WFE39267.1 CHAT domain-containing protein [Micromonospora sp. WMMD998]
MFERRRKKDEPRVEVLDAKSVAQIRGRHEEMSRLASRATALLGAGRVAEAEQVLTAAEEPARTFISETSFVVFKLLGQCARTNRRFDDARRHYGRAYQIACDLGDETDRTAVLLRSIAIAGFASVELAEGDLPEANKWYGVAVKLTRYCSDGPNLAAVLQSQAEVLHRMRDDRAADLYREALGQQGVGAEGRGIILDNLGRELFRQGKISEAIEHSRQAAALLAEAGSDYHRYKSLVNLAVMAGDTDPATATEAFVAAHDLIHRLHAQVDAAHYTEGYRRQVESINEEIRRRLNDPEVLSLSHPDFDAMLRDVVARRRADGWTLEGFRYAFNEVTAKHSVAEAERLILERRYVDAAPRLRLAELIWRHLGARHRLSRVWTAFGSLYAATGEDAEAWTAFEQARQNAHRIGDAQSEAGALIGLCGVAERAGGSDGLNSLELLAQARALLTFVAEQAGRSVHEFDGGALDRMEYGLCQTYGAVELAERYLRRSLDDVGDLPLSIRVARLYRLVRFLARQERFDETVPIQRELLAIGADTTEPRLQYYVNVSLGTIDLRAGRWTDDALRRFRAAFSAFEQLNSGALDLSEADYLAVDATMHYLSAAELALHLGHGQEAFHLLERAKSRSLLRALGARQPSGATDQPLLAEESRLWQQLERLRGQVGQALTINPDDPASPRDQARRLFENQGELDRLRTELTGLWDRLADDQPQVRAHRLAEPITASEAAALLATPDGGTLVEFFCGDRAVHAFVASAGGLTTRHVADVDDPDLLDLVPLLVDDSASATDQLLTNAAYARLSRLIDDAAGAGPVFVVPHQRLHLAPLHLRPGADGVPEVRPRTYLLPSASALRSTRTAAPRPRDGAVVIGGDPLGDLPFARGECVHAAIRLGAAGPRLGSAVTADWLTHALREPVRLVHLACHAVFNEHRPDRSGLILATEGGEPDLVTLSQLAGLNWSGALVVLSACRSGRHHVDAGDELAGLGRTLLAAGAAALVVSFRRVPDLSTALLMTWFYDQVDATTALALDDIGQALAGAQRRLRDATARDLVAWAVRDGTTGDERTTLACRILATAHRAAHNQEEYTTWQDHAEKLLNGEGPPAAWAWSRQAAVASDPAYRVRPFAAPTNWASFSIFGAG